MLITGEKVTKKRKEKRREFIRNCGNKHQKDMTEY